MTAGHLPGISVMVNIHKSASVKVRATLLLTTFHSALSIQHKRKMFLLYATIKNQFKFLFQLNVKFQSEIYMKIAMKQIQHQQKLSDSFLLWKVWVFCSISVGKISEVKLTLVGFAHSPRLFISIYFIHPLMWPPTTTTHRTPPYIL